MKKLTLVLTMLTLSISISFAQEVQIHGFISQGGLYSTEYSYIAENSKDFSLDLQEIGINFQTDVSDKLHLGIQLLSRDVGVYGEGRVTVDWAYGDYYISDALKLAFGRVKNRLGLYTTIQDFDFLRTWAVLPTAIYDLGLRTVNATLDGVQIHGNLDTKLAGNLDYAITYGKLNLGRTSDIAAYAGQLTTYAVEAATTKYNLGVNAVYNTPLDGLRLNGTYLRTEQFAFDPIHQTLDLTQAGMGVLNFDYHIETDIDNIYAGAQYLFNKLEITAEYNMGTRHVKEYITGLNQTVLDMIGKGKPELSDEKYYGGYLGATYRLNQNIGVGGYYQIYMRNDDLDDEDPRKSTSDIALSLAYNIGYNMVIKLEGHFVNGLGPLSVSLNDELTGDLSDLEETWMYGVAKISYNF
ncbi:MAG: hypothetical protein JXQ65_06320 [Candidatus Marinimicrobia bacterium]|nr:hypothetical protein [Candidatus Neomarinimicrobiota bacterium]